ncbi:MAG: PP2C family protein-serine/threonine phosphatase [Polyangiaceae bacterium]
MLPSADVGGDYFDILPAEGVCWVGIGDVAGHGLRTGLVMLMIQSVVAALTTENPWASPSQVLRVLNSVVYENVRQRLGQDEHATLCLLRVGRDGHVLFAGAHEDVVLYRARTRQIELISTSGAWIAAGRHMDSGITDGELRLELGDMIVLYTDGVTGATNELQRPFGIDALCREVEAVGDRSVDEVKEHLLSVVRNYVNRQQDDMTLVVLRYRG